MLLRLRLAITSKLAAALEGLLTEKTNRIITTENGQSIVP